MDRISVESVLGQIRAMQDMVSGHAAKAAPAAAGAADFAQVLRASLEHASSSEREAGRLSEAFEKGEPGTSLQDTVIAMQKASIEFQTIVQVRNRVVAAYQDMMNMQV